MRGPSKTTIEKAVIAERVLNEAAMSGRKLAKEVLEEFMVLFGGLASQFQPKAPEGQKIGPTEMVKWLASGDEPYFEKYADKAILAAHHLAKYQSPTFKAIEVHAPAPLVGTAGTIEGVSVQRTKFTLHIFGDDPRNKVIEHEPAKKRA